MIGLVFVAMAVIVLLETAGLRLSTFMAGLVVATTAGFSFGIPSLTFCAYEGTAGATGGGGGCLIVDDSTGSVVETWHGGLVVITFPFSVKLRKTSMRSRTATCFSLSPVRLYALTNKSRASKIAVSKVCLMLCGAAIFTILDG